LDGNILLTLGTLLKYSWKIMHINFFSQLTQRWRTSGHFVSKFLTENIVQSISFMLFDAGSPNLVFVVHHGMGQCRISYLGHCELLHDSGYFVSKFLRENDVHSISHN